MRNKTYRLGAVAVLLAAAVACSTTTFESTWRSPEARPLRLTGKKVVAVFVGRNGTRRRRAEDAMVREIQARGAQAVPSYTVLTEEQAKDPEASKAKLEQLGFAGAVVMRVVGTETELTYEPGIWTRPYYRHFWGGYWAWGWGRVWEPGYLRADKVVRVETLVYSLEQDQLVWAGVSRTMNPDRIDDLIADLAKAVTSQMEKDGLLPRA
jgi:hypothetical protein